jgi:ATP-dependent DNA helicase RecQ
VAPPPPPELLDSLDDAIISVVRTARPSVGRSTCVQILHGARSKKIKENSYDGLRAYAIASHMRREQILARVDELIEAGRLASTGGKFPKLKVVPRPTAVAA